MGLIARFKGIPMSRVTNAVLLQSSYLGDWHLERLRLVNAYLKDELVGSLVSVDDPRIAIEREDGPVSPWYGGVKYLECEMAFGALNHLNLEEFVNFLKTKISWDDSVDGTCQLLVKDQETYRFRLIDIYDPYL
jgi:hypothetical protein